MSSDDETLDWHSINQGYYKAFFVEGHRLGRGYRGTVFYCQHLLDGILVGHYAVKKVAIGNRRRRPQRGKAWIIPS
jgi:hypothetical protein